MLVSRCNYGVCKLSTSVGDTDIGLSCLDSVIVSGSCAIVVLAAQHDVVAREHFARWSHFLYNFLFLAGLQINSTVIHRYFGNYRTVGKRIINGTIRIITLLCNCGFDIFLA